MCISEQQREYFEIITRRCLRSKHVLALNLPTRPKFLNSRLTQVVTQDIKLPI